MSILHRPFDSDISTMERERFSVSVVYRLVPKVKSRLTEVSDLRPFDLRSPRLIKSTIIKTFKPENRKTTRVTRGERVSRVVMTTECGTEERGAYNGRTGVLPTAGSVGDVQENGGSQVETTRTRESRSCLYFQPQKETTRMGSSKTLNSRLCLPYTKPSTSQGTDTTVRSRALNL